MMTRPAVLIFVIITISAILNAEGAIQYPATIQTKGSTAGVAQVDLKNVENYDQMYFDFDVALEMGSTVRLNIKGSSANGDRIIENHQLPGEDFTRVIKQTVTKSRDDKGTHIAVHLDTTLKLAGTKEKYGKTTIALRIEPGRRAAHYWDIKHEYNNNYEGEEEGEICLGCDVDENEDQIDPGFSRTTTTPGPPEELWEGMPYAYKYAVNDAPTQNLHQNDVQSDGQVVRGEYRTLLPDGRTQIVKYTADWKNGFVPVITYTQAGQNNAFSSKF